MRMPWLPLWALGQPSSTGLQHGAISLQRLLPRCQLSVGSALCPRPGPSMKHGLQGFLWHLSGLRWLLTLLSDTETSGEKVLAFSNCPQSLCFHQKTVSMWNCYPRPSPASLLKTHKWSQPQAAVFCCELAPLPCVQYICEQKLFLSSLLTSV